MTPKQRAVLAAAIREALEELREEQGIAFQSESDEKFALGYIYKTVHIRLSAEKE